MLSIGLVSTEIRRNICSPFLLYAIELFDYPQHKDMRVDMSF